MKYIIEGFKILLNGFNILFGKCEEKEDPTIKKIKKLIKDFENMSDEEYIELHNRAKKKRENSPKCGYCEYFDNGTGYPVYTSSDKDEFYDLSIHGNLMFVNSDEFMIISAEFEINYCPICGRKLEE
jgi:hypothetical protein